MIITLVLSSWLFLSAQAEPTITVDKLADNVCLYTHNAHRSLFVVTDKAILVTDPQSPERRCAISRRCERSVRRPSGISSIATTMMTTSLADRLSATRPLSSDTRTFRGIFRGIPGAASSRST